MGAISRFAQPGSIPSAAKGLWATVWLSIRYPVAVGFVAGWPYFMITKITGVFVQAINSAALRDVWEADGAPLLGVLGSLALGDFVTRHHSGRKAFITAGVLFALVLVGLWGLSSGSELSSGQPYCLVWPPHLLFVLAAVALGRRRAFRRAAECVGLLSWLMAAALAVGVVGLVLSQSAEHGHVSYPALLVTCVGVGAAAVLRVIRLVRGLREEASKG